MRSLIQIDVSFWYHKWKNVCLIFNFPIKLPKQNNKSEINFLLQAIAFIQDIHSHWHWHWMRLCRSSRWKWGQSGGRGDLALLLAAFIVLIVLFYIYFYFIHIFHSISHRPSPICSTPQSALHNGNWFKLESLSLGRVVYKRMYTNTTMSYGISHFFLIKLHNFFQFVLSHPTMEQWTIRKWHAIAGQSDERSIVSRRDQTAHSKGDFHSRKTFGLSKKWIKIDEHWCLFNRTGWTGLELVLKSKQ